MFKRKQKKDFPQSRFFNTAKERNAQKKKMVKRVLFLLIFAFLVYRFFAGPYGFIQIHSLWKEKKSLESQSKMLKAEIIDLEIEKKRLSEDQFYLEKLAREKLGMVKEGEQMFKIIHTEKPNSEKEKNPDQIFPSDSLSP